MGRTKRPPPTPMMSNMGTHTAWIMRDGFFKARIYSITQTAEGYSMLGTEFGLDSIAFGT